MYPSWTQLFQHLFDAKNCSLLKHNITQIVSALFDGRCVGKSVRDAAEEDRFVDQL